MRNLRDRYPWVEIRNLTPALDAARLLKSPREIALIRRATRLACLSILEAMRSTEPGIYEHELDGVSRFVYYRHGAQGEAYYSLVASGENAWYPHYASGKRMMKEGEMVLMDHAPDVGYYMSDITRMWPVSGRFSANERELYGFYLRPGMVFTIEPQFRVPEEKLYFRLEDLIVIGETKAEVVSDWLAMDTDAIEKVMGEPGILQRYPRDPEGLPAR